MTSIPPDPAAAERLTASLRRLIDLVRRTQASGETAKRAQAAIEAASAELEGFAHPGPFHQRALVFDGFKPEDFGGEPPTDFAEFFPYSPLVGPRNPIAPPAEFEVRDRRIIGRVRPGAAYTGPPGCVHGGVIAAIFDELLGCANVCNGIGGMTGTLRVIYRAPAPIDSELRLEAWVDRVEGRKVFTCGSMHCAETLTAEAEGIFIQGAVQRHAESLSLRPPETE